MLLLNSLVILPNDKFFICTQKTLWMRLISLGCFRQSQGCSNKRFLSNIHRLPSQILVKSFLVLNFLMKRFSPTSWKIIESGKPHTKAIIFLKASLLIRFSTEIPPQDIDHSPALSLLSLALVELLLALPPPREINCHTSLLDCLPY